MPTKVPMGSTAACSQSRASATWVVSRCSCRGEYSWPPVPGESSALGATTKVDGGKKLKSKLGSRQPQDWAPTPLRYRDEIDMNGCGMGPSKPISAD